MQFKSISLLIKPLLKSGHKWQYVDINGHGNRPKYYFSTIQWIIIAISIGLVVRLPKGISKEIVGYVIAAFSISVSLFMSLLVNIFDKFDSHHQGIVYTSTMGRDSIDRLKQKHNFFRRFISITSYLVILSILVIVLCSFTFIFNLSARTISYNSITLNWKEIEIGLTIKNIFLNLYRLTLNYFLLNYLLLTFFITGSAYEYYMSEMEARRIS